MPRLTTGSTIAGYRIDSFVGRGGMGEVYRAEEVESGRIVALKLIGGNGDGDFEARFRREAAIAASLDHPNVAAVYETGVDDGRAYIAMRFVEGPDLATVLAEEPLPLERAVRILSEVAAALDAAHDRGLVHRDVKPGNILLEGHDGGEVAVLADFGLVKELAVEDGATATGTVLGTPDYMAPEQVRLGIVDARSDVYSLGCVLFQMLTGRVPFERDSDVAKIWAHVNDDPPSLAELVPKLPSGLDAVVAKALAKEPEDRYGSAGDLARAALAAAEGSLPEGLRGVAAPKPERVAAPCPYKGLAAFQPEDAEFFFGREELVAELVTRLRRSRFLAVVGASGSGKSSLVRAGLLPSLSRPYALITPGERPLEALAQADAEVVLAVDQFEELFTLCRDEAEREDFVRSLLAWPEPAVIVLRADFYGHCAEHPALATALEGSQALVGSMNEQELRRAIEHPAQRVGLHLEHRLIETALHDVLGEPGALPLLSHALLETWKRRIGRTLTLGGYLEAGGVEGAVAKTAEEVYQGLSPEQQPLARSIFLRLTALGEGTEDTRRRVAVSELVLREGEDQQVEAVLDTLVGARLVTRNEDAVEVAHEALIRHWPTLRVWLDEDREGRRTHRRLTEAAQEWDTLGREQSALYRGARFAATAEWADSNPEELNEQERAFLEASRAAEQSELDRTRRRNRRLRILVAALALLLVGAAVAAVIAVRQTGTAHREARIAREQERVAEQQARVARSQKLSIQAQSLASTQLDLALLLGVEAQRLDNSVETRKGLLAVLTTTPQLTGFAQRFGPDLGAMALERDGTTLAIGGQDGRVRVWDLGTGDPLSDAVDAGVGSIYDIAFSPDGTLLAVSGDNGTRFRDVRTLQQRGGLMKGFSEWVAFSPDGTKLACSGGDGVLRLWSVPSATRIAPSLRVSPTRATGVAFFPDSSRLVVGTREGTAVIVNARTGRLIGRPLRVTQTGEAYAVAFSPDGRTLATGAEDGAITLWDASSLTPRGEPLRFHDSLVYALAFSQDGELLASTGDGGDIAVWDPATGTRIGQPLRGHGELVFDLTFSGARSLISAASNEVGTWNLDALSVGRRLPIGEGQLKALGLSSDGRTVAVGGRRGLVQLLDAASMAPTGPPLSTGAKRLFSLDWIGDEAIAIAGAATVKSGEPRGGRVIVLDVQGRRVSSELVTGGAAAQAVAASPDGRLIAVGDRGGRLTIWDARDGHEVSGPVDADAFEVKGVAFSPDGRLVATAGSMGVSVWQVAGGEKLWSRKVGANVNAIDWLRDGKALVAGSGLGSVLVLAAHTGKTLGATDSTIGEVTSVAVSPQGEEVAVTSLRGSVALLELAPLRVLYAVHGHVGHANGTRFLTQSTVASVGDEGSLVFWEIDPKAWATQACQLAGRNLNTEESRIYVPRTKARTCPAWPSVS